MWFQNPKEGQPKTIEKDIENLALKYIKEELSIILAITIGNDDMVNSESLRLAKEYDNKGSRTIAVLTKVDLMDPSTSGTYCCNIATDCSYGLTLDCQLTTIHFALAPFSPYLAAHCSIPLFLWNN